MENCPEPKLLLRYHSVQRLAALDALVHLLRVAAAALLLSNSIRRWLVYEAEAPISGGKYMHLRIDGCRVKGLAPQATVLEGIASAVLRSGKRWPGLEASITDAPPLRGTRDCPSWRRFLAEDVCPPCIYVDAAGARLKPWWLVAGLMVAYDERCWCRGPREEGAGASPGGAALR